jgi:uncharacterized protein YecE (DUF72 family)
MTLSAVVAATAGAGATVVASPRTAPTEHRAAAAATTAKLRLTRGGDVWMSARATQTGLETWNARVRSQQRITTGRYKLRVEFSVPLVGDVVERYVARIRRVD